MTTTLTKADIDASYKRRKTGEVVFIVDVRLEKMANKKREMCVHYGVDKGFADNVVSVRQFLAAFDRI